MVFVGCWVCDISLSDSRKNVTAAACRHTKLHDRTAFRIPGPYTLAASRRQTFCGFPIDFRGTADCLIKAIVGKFCEITAKLSPMGGHKFSEFFRSATSGASRMIPDAGPIRVSIHPLGRLAPQPLVPIQRPEGHPEIKNSVCDRLQKYL